MLLAFGYEYNDIDDKWNIKDMACDYIYSGNNIIDFELPGTLGIIQSYSTWLEHGRQDIFPALDLNEYLDKSIFNSTLNFIYLSIYDISEKLISKLKNDLTAVIILETNNSHGMAEQRRFFIELINNNCLNPVIINRKYSNIPSNLFQLFSATDLGGLFIDGLGDGAFINIDKEG